VAGRLKRMRQRAEAFGEEISFQDFFRGQVPKFFPTRDFLR